MWCAVLRCTGVCLLVLVLVLLVPAGRRDSRHMIAHLELIDPADIPRFALLGVTASFQPFWAFADEYIVSMTEPLLGPERSKWCMALCLFRCC